MRTACLLGAAGLAAQWGPALTSIGPLRRRIMPKLAGIASSADVALSYDDGPDPKPTPQFLDLLASYDVSATFFLLGSAVAGNATLVKEMAGAGHELAVHGWDHQCLAWKRPGLLTDELRRIQHTVEDLTGASSNAVSAAVRGDDRRRHARGTTDPAADRAVVGVQYRV